MLPFRKPCPASYGGRDLVIQEKIALAFRIAITIL